jgi:hypothetical protein
MSRLLGFWVALALMASGLLCVSPPAQASDGGAPTLVTARGGCSEMRMAGRVLTRDGSPLRRYGVAVYLHRSDRPLDHTRANKRGGFGMDVCRSRALSRYARHHHGHVNFDVVAHRYATKRGDFWIQVIDPIPRSDRVAVGRGFTRAHATEGRRGRAGSAGVRRNLPPKTGTVDIATFYVNPAVMFAETVPHMHAEYRVTSSSISSVKASIGISAGGFGAAGSMTIADSGTYWRAGTVSPTKKHARRALLVTPTLAVDSEYVCRPTYPFGVIQGTSSLKCATESSGEWTGALKRTPVDYKSCSEGSAVLDGVDNHAVTEVGVGQGVTFNSEVAATSLDTSFAFSTTYGADTFMVYKLDQTKRRHRFCLGGNGRFVRDSSALYVTTVKGDASSCDPPGPATCSHSDPRRPVVQ